MGAQRPTRPAPTTVRDRRSWCRAEGVYAIEYRSTDKAGNVEAIKSVSFTIDEPEDSVEVEEDVGGTVPLVMSLTTGGPATFGEFVPGVARDYLASTTVNAISTVPRSMLTISDRSSVATGHLVNGSLALPQPLQVSAGGAFAPIGGSANPTLLKAGPRRSPMSS